MSFIESSGNYIKTQVRSLCPLVLEKECQKATKNLSKFIFKGNTILKNPIVAPKVIRKAKGLVIFKIGKAGMNFSIKGGSGIFVSRLPDGTWSAPIALKTGGFGFGHQFGAEIVTFVMVLNTEEAVKNFYNNENITIGGNLSATIGHIGFSAEVNTTAKRASPIISYGKPKGLYLGWSIEGAVIQQNDEANIMAYGREINPQEFIEGSIPKPEYAQTLYTLLEEIEALCEFEEIYYTRRSVRSEATKPKECPSRTTFDEQTMINYDPEMQENANGNENEKEIEKDNLKEKN